MQRPVTELKGVGPARAKVLEAEAGIRTVGDLLYYFPRRRVDRSITTNSTMMNVGDTVTMIVTVASTFVAHGRRSRLMAKCRTPGGEAVTLIWFRGVQYFRNVIHQDETLIVSGKLEFYNGMQIAHPDFEVLDPDDENELLHTGRIIPLYASGETLRKNHLDSRGFRRLISAALNDLPDLEVPEMVPAELMVKHNLMNRLAALRNIHYPEDEQVLQEARRRLKYEELYLFNILMYHKSLLREGFPRRVTPLPFGEAPSYTKLLEALPFEFTNDQQVAVRTIVTECRGEHSEAYLLQGDVGSGKTVAALAVALHYADAGVQSAILAPTEVLARQHYRTFTELLGLEGANRVELLLGGGRKKDRELRLERIGNGEAELVIGTHSLLEDNVVFHRLGFVVIDEQHRFGVGQRGTIRAKGMNPDTVAMTATPIPRTLCLSEFADLKLVTLREKPAGRKPVQTMWLKEDRRAAMYKSVRKHVAAGRQAYIVYPMIAESEKIDLKAATDGYEELSQTIFPDFSVALLHGRLKAPEKDAVMNDFRAGKVQILVSTTVIEVGVDVPNATVMIIEHAERFGISQLHQLRGRVGRGTEESFCVLMSDADNDEAVERLTAVTESQDGFHLAEVDMKIRGPGELLGLRQHGLPGFRIADLVYDRQLTEAAYQDARAYPDVGETGREFIRKQFEQGVVIFPN